MSLNPLFSCLHEGKAQAAIKLHGDCITKAAENKIDAQLNLIERKIYFVLKGSRRAIPAVESKSHLQSRRRGRQFREIIINFKERESRES